MFHCPQVQGRCRDLVNRGYGQPIDCHVNGLEVALAGIASLDPYRSYAFGGIPWEFFVVLLAACGAKNPAKIPLPIGKSEHKS